MQTFSLSHKILKCMYIFIIVISTLLKMVANLLPRCLTNHKSGETLLRTIASHFANQTFIYGFDFNKRT